METEPASASMSQGQAAVLTAEQIAAMDGLDYLHGLVAGRYAHPPMAALTGYRLVRVARGEVAIRAIAEARHRNPMGGVHGGWYGAVLDSVLGCAVMTGVRAGHWYTTLEYKINLTRAVPVGLEVEAVGTLRHAGRSTGVSDAVLRGVADGRVYATGSTTCLIMPAAAG